MREVDSVKSERADGKSLDAIRAELTITAQDASDVNLENAFSDWFASAAPQKPYTEQHLRWAFNAGEMTEREWRRPQREARMARALLAVLDETEPEKVCECPSCASNTKIREAIERAYNDEESQA